MAGKADEQRPVDDCGRDTVRIPNKPMLLASKTVSGLNMSWVWCWTLHRLERKERGGRLWHVIGES